MRGAAVLRVCWPAAGGSELLDVAGDVAGAAGPRSPPASSLWGHRTKYGLRNGLSFLGKSLSPLLGRHGASLLSLISRAGVFSKLELKWFA